MSEKSSTFVGMNDEMKLRLAYAEIEIGRAHV